MGHLVDAVYMNRKASHAIEHILTYNDYHKHDTTRSNATTTLTVTRN